MRVNVAWMVVDRWLLIAAVLIMALIPFPRYNTFNGEYSTLPNLMVKG